jgi:nucleoside transporter
MNTTSKGMLARLSTMMFLEFFIWGCWFTSIAVYMTQEGMGTLTHWPYTVNPIAAILAPFILGLIADRFFPTEKVLAFLHIVGGLILFIVPQTSGTPLLFIVLMLAYNLCYMPTLGLANALAFHHLQDQEKQFPVVRVFGTVGWIVAGLFISFGLSYLIGSMAEKTAIPIYSAAVCSLILGFYSFTLPHTPPRAKGEAVSFRTLAGLDALKYLGSKSFYAFVLCSFLISIPLAAYYNYTQLYLENSGIQQIAGIQILGQASEVIFMLLIPLFFIRYGVKWMLGVGMLAWVVRYVLFAMAAPTGVYWMVILGIVLHGICYDFFFVTGQMYVEQKSNAKIRGQAQGFIILVTYGFGFLFGAQIAGRVYLSFLKDADRLTVDQWQYFWFIPAIFALLVFLFFIMVFKDTSKSVARQKSVSLDTEE